MPIYSIRSQFADLLAEAKELLGEHTEEEIHEEDLDHLKDEADAFVDHLHEHSDDFAPNAIRRAEELQKEIEALDVEDDDFEEDFAGLESELHDMAARLGFDLPEPEPDEDDTRVIGPAIIRDGIANDPRIVFDDKVTPEKLANYALATSLYSPVGQSAFHQRQQGLTLLLAGLLSRGPGFLPGPPVEEPPPPAPPPPEVDGEEVIIKLIDAVVEGGNDKWPNLREQLFRVGANSAANLLAYVRQGWPQNQREGLWLHKKLMHDLGLAPDDLPPWDELDGLVKAARRWIRDQTTPVA